MRGYRYFLVNVNPTPWVVPPFQMGRKNGKTFPIAGQDAGLASYKEAVREQLEDTVPSTMLEETALLDIEFYFWRQIDSWTTQSGRKSRAHVADLTNLQKSTEDALHGIFFKNDNQVASCNSHIIEQSEETEGKVAIGVQLHEPADIPLVVRMMLTEVEIARETEDSNLW